MIKIIIGDLLLPHILVSLFVIELDAFGRGNDARECEESNAEHRSFCRI